MEEWKSYSLPDIARFSQGKQVPLEDQYEICKPGFDRFVRIVDYTSGGVQTPRYVSCDDKYRAEASDIIMIRYGTPGRVYRGIEGIIANNMFKIIPNEDIVSKQFLFWYLSDDSIYQQLLASQSSTTMPAIAFGNLKNIIVNVPPKKTQERIVSILNKLDDKIHNNNRINHNLGETADEILIDAIHNQAIKKDALGSICCYVKDKVDCGILDNENYVSTDNMKPNKGGIELSSSVPDGKCISFILKDVLVSNIRPYFKKIWQATNKGGCSNDVLCFRSTNNTPSVLYHLLRSDSFFDYVMTGAKGSKMPRGDKSQIMKWEVPLFKPNYLYNLEKQLSVIDNSVSLNDLENKRLTVLRDTLLPSLLNGHINC